MPLPEKRKDENKNSFINRCMGDETMKKEYPDNKQRAAVCLSKSEKSKGGIFNFVFDILGFSLSCDDCNDTVGEEINIENLIIPHETQYVSFGETEEEYDVTELSTGRYEYMDPVTFEIFYYNRPGNYRRNNRYLRFIGRASGAEYQGRKVTLNKPFRTPGGPKKFSVYVKNEKGNVVKVNFGDPNMKIKKNIPERRKSFRARHKCDQQKDKTTPAYWSCKMW
jgi:hypothetical protein